MKDPKMNWHAEGAAPLAMGFGFRVLDSVSGESKHSNVVLPRAGLDVGLPDYGDSAWPGIGWAGFWRTARDCGSLGCGDLRVR